MRKRKVVRLRRGKHLVLRYYKQGVKYLRTGNYERADQFFTKVIQLDPNFASVYRSRGDLYRRNGKLDLALQNYNKAIELAPNSAENYKARAYFYQWGRKSAEAIFDCNKVIELDLNNQISYVTRADIYAKQGKLDEAFQDYDKAIGLNPSEPSTYCSRASFYRQLGKTNQALQDYNKAIELKPTGKRFYLERASLYARLGKTKQALEDYNKLIALTPKKPWNYYSRARFYEAHGRLDKALQDYNKVIVLRPKNAEGYRDKASFYARQGELDKALQDYTKAIELDPKNSENYYARAKFYQGQGKFDLTLQDYNKAIELDPKNWRIYEARAGFYKWQNQLDKTIEDYNKVIEVEPTEAWGYWHRAEVYKNLGEMNKALSDCNKAIDLRPNAPKAYQERAELYRELGRIDDALSDYNKAITVAAFVGRSYSYLKRARFYHIIKEKEKSLADYNKAIELEPHSTKTYLTRAIFYQIQHDFDSALQDYNKSIEISPRDPEAYLERSNCYKRIGGKQLTLARRDAESVIKLIPGRYEGYFQKGLVCLDEHQYEEALKCFETALGRYFDKWTFRSRFLIAFYREWCCGLVDYRHEDLQSAIKCFSSAQDYLGRLPDYRKKYKDIHYVSRSISAYLQLFPLDDAMKKTLSDPAKLFQQEDTLEGLYQSFDGQLKLSKAQNSDLKEIHLLLQVKRDICRILLPQGKNYSVEREKAEPLLKEIEHTVTSLHFPNIEEFMSYLRQNRQKLEEKQAFTNKLAEIGSIADGAISTRIASQTISGKMSDFSKTLTDKLGITLVDGVMQGGLLELREKETGRKRMFKLKGEELREESFEQIIVDLYPAAYGKIKASVSTTSRRKEIKDVANKLNKSLIKISIMVCGRVPPEKRWTEFGDMVGKFAKNALAKKTVGRDKNNIYYKQIPNLNQEFHSLFNVAIIIQNEAGQYIWNPSADSYFRFTFQEQALTEDLLIALMDARKVICSQGRPPLPKGQKKNKRRKTVSYPEMEQLADKKTKQPDEVIEETESVDNNEE